jgi:hypothetical protein
MARLEQLRTMAPRAVLGVWFAAMVALGAALLAKHAIALPAPVENARLSGALTELRAPGQSAGWMSVHVLYAECRCSHRIVDHLLSSTRPAHFREVVLWVGNGAPSPALAERFDVRRIGSAELARYGIESAPLLLVVDPKSEVRYSGGYTTRKQGPMVADLRIMEEAQEGPLAALPVFGCAVSERLNRLLPGLRGL